MTGTAELELRVTSLETVQNETTQTLRWTVAKLGRIAAVQDEHTLRLERIETRLDGVESRLDSVEMRLDRVEMRLEKVETRLDGLQNEFSAFRRELPVMIGDVMREVLKEQGSK